MASSRLIYGRLEILKLEHQVFLQNCLFVYDALNGNSPECFNDYFLSVKNVHDFGTRNATNNVLFLNHYSSVRYGMKSITVQCILS